MNEKLNLNERVVELLKIYVFFVCLPLLIGKVRWKMSTKYIFFRILLIVDTTIVNTIEQINYKSVRTVHDNK